MKGEACEECLLEDIRDVRVASRCIVKSNWGSYKYTSTGCGTQYSKRTIIRIRPEVKNMSSISSLLEEWDIGLGSHAG